MRRSWFDRPWFFPAVVASFTLGNALDLVGTYIYQPHFEHEANPLYVTLQPYGFRLNWPMVILGKILTCVVSGYGLRAFLKARRRHYPARPSTFRELLTHFLYGRPLRWIESFFRMPRSFKPGLLAALALWSFHGPYYAYLGYGNLASHYGWWQLGGFDVGRYYFDWSAVLWLALSTAGFCRLLWLDFRAEPDPIVPPSSAEAA